MADVDALDFAVFGKLLPDPGLVVALGNGGEVERELLSHGHVFAIGDSALCILRQQARVVRFPAPRPKGTLATILKVGAPLWPPARSRSLREARMNAPDLPA